MARKGSKGKPTRKDIDSAFKIIGQKLAYLEEYTIANERVFDIFLEFIGKKEEFIEHLKAQAEKNKAEAEKNQENSKEEQKKVDKKEE